MNLTDGETLILMMLCDIHKHLNIEGEVDAAFVQSAIFSDNLWGLEWRFQGLFQGKTQTPDLVRNVVNVLDMWSMLETFYNRLSAEDKAFVKSEANVPNVRFPGFDGNDEYEVRCMSVARFLVEDLGRFSNFKNRDFNSHTQMMDKYDKMLVAFEPLRKQIPDAPLTSSEIISILNAPKLS